MNGCRYARPLSLEAATSLLARAPGGRVLAGGTDLLVALRAGALRPELVVDIKHIPGLDAIDWTGEGDLLLGACVTLDRIGADPRIAATFPALSEGANAVGSIQIRSRATIGGNLVNASPCMDTAPALLVYGALLMTASPGGGRELPVEGLFAGVKATVLEPAEILTAVRLQAPVPGTRSGFEKLRRGPGHDLALVNVAMVVNPAAALVRTAIGACAPTPVLLPEVAIAGATPDELADRLASVAQEHIRPIDDVRASAEYRTDMVAVLVRRLIRRLFTESGSAATAGR